MTTLAEWWTPEAWSARLASENPLYPYDWAVGYQDGTRLTRLAAGTSRGVPLERLAWLHITGPNFKIDIPVPPGQVRGLILRATVERHLSGDGHRIARWTFGFQTATGFWGFVLDLTGRLTRWQGGTDPCDDAVSSS
jgi:hypothetical protein